MKLHLLYYSWFKYCYYYLVKIKTFLNKFNQLRLTQSKDHYPVDEMLLKAMENYFPDCCGVAIGFDRLLMIELEANNISDVLSLPSV